MDLFIYFSRFGPRTKKIISIYVYNENIDIIMNNINNNPSLPPLKINPNIIRKILPTCTTEVPLQDHLGDIYIQTDGISMGSVLHPIFSNFYMSDLENKIFNCIRKPSIYLRYADDILILANVSNEINIIQVTFQNYSILNFTQELTKTIQFPFKMFSLILTIITSLPLLTKTL